MTVEIGGLQAVNAGTKAKGSAALDQNSFLKLMSTQLRAQDPFSPIDNTQMVAQMAQFSQVSGIAEMNTTLKAVLARLEALQPIKGE